MDLGLIHVYYGYGKGKTSSAIGLAIRASGHNKKVLFTSFLKDFSSGEFEVIRNNIHNITLFECSPVENFFSQMSEEQKTSTKKSQYTAFIKTMEKAIAENFDILILDELIDAIDLECITLDEVIDFLNSKPKTLEVIITGHSENIKLIELADYVTEFTSVKHPFSKGISARDGIENW